MYEENIINKQQSMLELMIAKDMLLNDRFYLSLFVATHGFRESDFDYY